MKKQVLVVLCLAGMLHRCGNGTGVLAPIYVPQVVFAGYINNQYDSLTGNLYWPNRCMLVGDTVRMYFYSSTFSERNRIRNGDLLRIDIYPQADVLVGKREVLFHMARYGDYNRSYTIHPTSPLSESGRVGARMEVLERRSGGSIHLVGFNAGTGPVPGTYGERLEILRGRIMGRVE